MTCSRNFQLYMPGLYYHRFAGYIRHGRAEQGAASDTISGFTADAEPLGQARRFRFCQSHASQGMMAGPLDAVLRGFEYAGLTKASPLIDLLRPLDDTPRCQLLINIEREEARPAGC